MIPLKTPWWKFPCAILAFAVAYLFAPILIDLLLKLTNLFSPQYYRSSNDWIHIASSALGAGIAFMLVRAILKDKHPVFCLLLALVSAVYSLFVGVYNFRSGYTDGIQLVSTIAITVVSIGFAVYFGQQTASRAKETET